MEPCPYKNIICAFSDCQKEPFRYCHFYQQLESQQLSVAVQYYKDNELNLRDDLKWLAGEFKVPMNKLEKAIFEAQNEKEWKA